MSSYQELFWSFEQVLERLRKDCIFTYDGVEFILIGIDDPSFIVHSLRKESSHCVRLMGQGLKVVRLDMTELDLQPGWYAYLEGTAAVEDFIKKYAVTEEELTMRRKEDAIAHAINNQGSPRYNKEKNRVGTPKPVHSGDYDKEDEEDEEDEDN